jgi:methylglutamate dehydrogenase subunit D
MDLSTLLSRSTAWQLESVATSTASGSAVRVMRREGLAFATMISSRRQGRALAERIERIHGLKLPQGPQRAAAGEAAFIGVGPGVWLATSERGLNTFAETLAGQIGDLASVSDQTDGLAALRLSGPMLRAALCKLIPLDLHPRSFRVGDVAVTVAAHIGVTLWRLDDEDANSPVFELAVPRSMAGSFSEAFGESAGEFGIILVAGS